MHILGDEVVTLVDLYRSYCLQSSWEDEVSEIEELLRAFEAKGIVAVYVVDAFGISDSPPVSELCRGNNVVIISSGTE